MLFTNAVSSAHFPAALRLLRLRASNVPDSTSNSPFGVNPSFLRESRKNKTQIADMPVEFFDRRSYGEPF